jgi:8-oxo-dGTP pyrophosphatase MutT (NUDIX family)
MDIKDRELHRITTTAIIYNNEGKYLITKRSINKKHFPGKWTVPGGGLTVDDYINTPITHGEHANQWYFSVTKALTREVKEEVGVEIDKPEYLLDLTFIKGDGTPVLVLSYFAKYTSGEVVLDEDATEFKWISVDEVSEYDLIEGIDGEIRMVDEILKKRSSAELIAQGV